MSVCVHGIVDSQYQLLTHIQTYTGILIILLFYFTACVIVLEYVALVAQIQNWLFPTSTSRVNGLTGLT